jgi:large subunit ribosomal protein L21
MLAIVETGGRQFWVEPLATLKVPALAGGVGETVEFDQVLLVKGDSGVTVGHPRVDGAKVLAEVVAQGREEKILVFHKKRRKRYQKMTGHRQRFTEIRIREIVSA